MDRPARILVVEDEGVIAMELAQNLGEFGYDVVGIAATGERAAALAEEQRPDLIVMDIMIKGPMDGIETAQRIRAARDVPVVFLTAYGDRATLERAKQTAPYGYLLKPYRPEALRAAVGVALYKHQLETQLRESEQWFAKTLHCISDGVIATDPAGAVRFINPVAERLTGRTGAEALGRPIAEVCRLLDTRSRRSKPNPVMRALTTGGVTDLESSLLARPDAEETVVDDGAAPIRDTDGRLLGGVLVFRDMTERRRMEEALRHSEERFHSAFDLAAMGMALTSTDGRLLQVNRALTALLGWSAEELQQATLASLSHPEHAGLERTALARLDADEAPSVQVEKLFLRRDGTPLWMQLSVSAVRGADRVPNYYIVQWQDIHARKTAEERLHFLAHHDPLTGLGNRTGLELKLDEALAAARRTGGDVALLFLDLDGFKHVNDSLGHQAGDLLLQQLAARLKSAAGEGEVVGRPGGDEFMVLLPRAAGGELAGAVARRLIETLALPCQVNGREVIVTGSIGIAVGPADGGTVEDLLRNADSALHRAKELGRNQYCFYSEDLTRRAVERLSLEHALRQALSREEFSLVYQPLVAHGQVLGMEALLRWQHPERGAVSPDLFVGLAEETNLLPDIGDWVLRTACGQLAEWREAGLTLKRVAVNVSFKQLVRLGFVSRVAAALADAGLTGGDLEIEITESSAMKDPARSIQALEGLRARGVQVSIDDFGTGYSSLSHLARLPVNRIKIDRTFVRDLPASADAAAVIGAIAALGRTLALGVIAEGVETAEQERFLHEARISEMQGYRFARPLVPAAAATLLHDAASGKLRFDAA